MPKNNTLKRSADGSLTLYAGTRSPGKDKESNWLPAPAGDFSLYIRAMGQEADPRRRLAAAADPGRELKGR